MSDAKRYLALDVGERRTGVAATDPTGTICVPLEAIRHRGMAELPAALLPLLAERSPEVLVVGVPYSRDGSAGPQAKKVLDFIEVLRKAHPDLPIEIVDESHSTDIAHEQMKAMGMRAAKRRGKADSLAALEILRRHVGI